MVSCWLSSGIVFFFFFTSAGFGYLTLGHDELRVDLTPLQLHPPHAAVLAGAALCLGTSFLSMSSICSSASGTVGALRLAQMDGPMP